MALNAVLQLQVLSHGPRAVLAQRGTNTKRGLLGLSLSHPQCSGAVGPGHGAVLWDQPWAGGTMIWGPHCGLGCKSVAGQRGGELGHGAVLQCCGTAELCYGAEAWGCRTKLQGCAMGLFWGGGGGCRAVGLCCGTMPWGCATDGAGWGHDSAWPWAPPSPCSPPHTAVVVVAAGHRAGGVGSAWVHCVGVGDTQAPGSLGDSGV